MSAKTARKISQSPFLENLNKFQGNKEHLDRFIDAIERKDEDAWNLWRKKNPDIRPDLRGIVLSRRVRRLGGIDLSNAILRKCDLTGLHAWSIQLQNADLRFTILDNSDLSFANVSGARMDSCRLVHANMSLCYAEGTNFTNSNLSHAILNGANLKGAIFQNAKVTGLSVWGVQTDENTKQDGLVLEKLGDFLEDLVDVDDSGIKPQLGKVNHLEAINLMYLIKDKTKLKVVIDALTEKLVLLLGNFSLRRQALLKKIEAKLTDLGYTPVIFNFSAPNDRDLIETVSLLAGLSCFLIVDLTKPRSTPLESMLIAPHLSLPMASIILEGENPFSMYQTLQAKYDWVLPTWTYKDEKHLLRNLRTAIVEPCERMRKKLRARKNKEYSEKLLPGRRKLLSKKS